MKILLVESKNVIDDLLYFYLEREGFTVNMAPNAQEGMDRIPSFQPDVILMDIYLHDTPGSLTSRNLLHNGNVPVIILSANESMDVKLRALYEGAEDYITKSVSNKELKARIWVVLRRYKKDRMITPVPTSIRMDLKSRAVYVEDEMIETTYTEFEIMKLFKSHPNQVFSRDHIIDFIQGSGSFISARSVDVHIMNLRKKLELDPRNPKYIKTVWGLGYKFYDPRYIG